MRNMTREKMTVSLDKDIIKSIEEIRTMKTQHPRVIDDKSHFVEKLLTIGLHAYKKKMHFFDTINLNNIDLSKVNY
jgi:hypothetical protein